MRPVCPRLISIDGGGSFSTCLSMKSRRDNLIHCTGRFRWFLLGSALICAASGCWREMEYTPPPQSTEAGKVAPSAVDHAADTFEPTPELAPRNLWRRTNPSRRPVSLAMILRKRYRPRNRRRHQANPRSQPIRRQSPIPRRRRRPLWATATPPRRRTQCRPLHPPSRLRHQRHQRPPTISRRCSKSRWIPTIRPTARSTARCRSNSGRQSPRRATSQFRT